MQLNEIHANNEHASTSLKTILLVFAIVLVGTLGYLVWDANNSPAPSNTDNSTAATDSKKSDSTTTEEKDGQKTYTHTKYNFSVTYDPITLTQVEELKNTENVERLREWEAFGVNFSKPSGSDCIETGNCDHYSFSVRVTSRTIAEYKQLEEVLYSGNPDLEKAPTYSKITVAGNSAEKSSIYQNGQEGGMAQKVLIRSGNYTYIIERLSGGYTKPDVFNSTKEAYDKFLSSIRFTN